jgi:adenosylcobyric acid synthase
MNAKMIMVQGTSSGVGKSLISMALCRHFYKKGLRVSPFKSQNMSLNSAVSIEGGEISRAQYLQAIACGKKPSTRMNPILLKPNGNMTQVIIRGVVAGNVSPKKYMTADKNDLLKIVLEDLESLSRENDVVVIEGAGSPVEMNLKERDISNMKIARAFDIPVVLIADIEKGGSFAQVVGTMELLEPIERQLIIGYILNKFRGDPSLLGGYPFLLARKYGFDFFGTMPHISHKLPQEDSMVNFKNLPHFENDVSVDVIKFPHISNFDDIDPITWNANVRFVDNGPLKGDMVILPGTKNTISDYEWMVKRGLDKEIKKAATNGKVVFGICGGYQILGEELEENGKKVKGLGLLNVKTGFKSIKKVSTLKGIVEFEGKEFEVEGYEIHHGISIAKSSTIPFAKVIRVNSQKNEYFDGAVEKNIFGTYFHGLFYNLEFTQALLNSVRMKKNFPTKEIKKWSIFEEIDRFTNFFEKNVDISKIERKIGI